MQAVYTLWIQSLRRLTDQQTRQKVVFFYLITLIYFAAIPTPDNGNYHKKGFFLDLNFSWAAVSHSLNKPKHIVAFFLLYKLLKGSCKAQHVIPYCLLFGLGIEFMQAFIPYRTGAIQDLLPNMVGTLLACLI